PRSTGDGFGGSGNSEGHRPVHCGNYLISKAIYGGRDGISMLEEISELVGLQVYTHDGIFLGNINNLVVDIDDSQVEGLFIGDTNPLLVEGSRAVSVPYRWIQSVGDIVILRYFPKRVSLKKKAK
ncbi:MAG: PRC-barrel domain-containing protein, partial [Candidatus Thorarchaeota archaeon]